ncbi:MAG: deoxyribose-phosphate aldolase [Bacillota bacterium]|nr:deoxyribose-phosphate aldolase [Bacillota bacterium]HHU62203.1 deoxyribose-phosphate aldolase [Natronincola sp.]
MKESFHRESDLIQPSGASQLASHIDHTLLKPTASLSQIQQLCNEAKASEFAAVCVNPCQVTRVKRFLKNSKVKICTVIGFPLGANSTLSKVMETRDAVANGADEIDMVINIGSLLEKDYASVYSDIKAVREGAPNQVLKVILETGYLTKEQIVRGCILTKMAGADYVKTSTGFGPGGATIEDIALMREVVGPNFGVKASGGIRDSTTALAMIKAGATRLGTSSSMQIVEGLRGETEY